MNQEELQALIGPDYKLQWVIGNGGMSTVWLADDLRYNRAVAIKVLRPEFSDNREFLDRFRNEASAAETIHSPNVVETYDYQELDSGTGHFCFIAMEYIEGESLADLLERNGAVPEEIALDYLEQAANGLAAIHNRGFVHRDIKPGNLMVANNGVVKITDFGIAKAAAAVPLTRTGMVVGTAQYVSPEQAQGLEVTSSSDVYSLGVVGYEMLTGHRPFSGDSSVSVAIAHINDAPPPMGTNISAQARELIGIMLRKDPARRYATGQELAQAISAVRFGGRPPQPSNAAPVTEYIEPATRIVPPMNSALPQNSLPNEAEEATKSNRNKILGWVIVVLVVLVAVIFALIRLSSGKESSTENQQITVVSETSYSAPSQTTEQRFTRPTEPTRSIERPQRPDDSDRPSSSPASSTAQTSSEIATVTVTVEPTTSASLPTRAESTTSAAQRSTVASTSKESSVASAPTTQAHQTTEGSNQ
ncbi:MAG: serine/threonine-protein kinase [Corynebacterium sp.]|nr:serine/threonine-protein kinase [Corynebacterium sp.]